MSTNKKPLKAGSPQHHRLLTLKKEIQQRAEVMLLLRREIVDKSKAWMCEAMIQGHAFIKAKENLTQGEFTEWAAIHCASVDPKERTTLMRHAINTGANPERVEELDDSRCLQMALALCVRSQQPKSSEEKEKRVWPIDWEGIGRATRFLNWIRAHPIKTWPAPSRKQLADDFEPIARELWPERFA